MPSAPVKNRRVLFLPLAVLLAASLACGGFQVRVTPTPKAVTVEPQPTLESTSAPEATQAPAAATTVEVPTPAAAAPAAGPTATPPPPTAAPVTRQARVAATGGLNVRDQASAKGKAVGRLAGNSVVAVLEGPVDAENYSWYRVDNGQGLVGWVAAGPKDDPWLVLVEQAAPAPQPTASTGRLVDRAVKVGDTVQVTTEANQVLTVRADPGRGAGPVARVPRGTRFSIKSGPVQADNLTWWELQGETVKGWAAEGDGTTRWLTPVEP